MVIGYTQTQIQTQNSLLQKEDSESPLKWMKSTAPKLTNKQKVCTYSKSTLANMKKEKKEKSDHSSYSSAMAPLFPHRPIN